MSVRISESERHAIAHARHQVDRASPDNPDVAFDYELVATLLNLIRRLRKAKTVGQTEDRS